MKTFQLIADQEFRKQLKRFEKKVQDRIKKKCQELKTAPVNGKKLTGHPFWRLRVGDYRIIYEIDFNKTKIILLAVGRRSKIYRKL